MLKYKTSLVVVWLSLKKTLLAAFRTVIQLWYTSVDSMFSNFWGYALSPNKPESAFWKVGCFVLFVCLFFSNIKTQISGHFICDERVAFSVLNSLLLSVSNREHLVFHLYTKKLKSHNLNFWKECTIMNRMLWTMYCDLKHNWAKYSNSTREFMYYSID